MKSQRQKDTGHGREPFSTETAPIDIVSQCRHRLTLLSTFIVGDGKIKDLVLTPVVADALYYSLMSIEDDLERVIGMMGRKETGEPNRRGL